ncbi:PilX N-terminal domain-containing pilus assembly protein [Ramlibacter sp. AN1015]|uniref:PilX N-terminal domain-containing pilus assembly protein n=1 Tax=Ramlibacter sp. AN1015 TaxID=3133428 RepID=UPI0030C3E8CE
MTRHRTSSHRSPRRQSGFSLLIGMIILVILTLLLVSAIRTNTGNLRIVGNQQVMDESIAAAQQVIEEVISQNFTIAPAAAVRPVDVNGDTNADYSVAVATPGCKSNTPIYNDFPNIRPECLASGSMINSGQVNAGGAPIGTAQSWCSLQLWEVQGESTGAAGGGALSSNVRARVTQGVSLFVPTGTSC